MNILLKNSDIMIPAPMRPKFWQFLDIFKPLGPKILEMGHLLHLKWRIDVR